MDLTERRPGPDVVRAVAMAGVVVMNYHGYLIIRGGSQGDGRLDRLFDPWVGPLSTRFAATFVLTAGVGVTLLTRTTIGDRARVADMRWRLVRRGLLLYGTGQVLDMIWPGTILRYYGAMFVCAALMFTWRARWLLATGAVAAVAGWAIRWWRYERELADHDTSWLTSPGARSPRGLVLDLFVNGTHPLLPWLAFLCAGIVLGRLLATPWWRQAAVVAGVALFVAGSIAAGATGSARMTVLLADDPFERGIAYTSSALGTALIAYAALSAVADRWMANPVIDSLRRAGQMSLTIYLAHILVFDLVVDWLGWIEPGGLGTALAFATVVWLAATGAAVAFHRRFGRGPAEWLYRRLTA
jgi:uncharacterized membrane protein YeiB